MQKLTKEQAIAVMGFTGVSTMSFPDFHADVEKRLGTPVFSHQFGDDYFANTVVKNLYREDFLAMCGG